MHKEGIEAGKTYDFSVFESIFKGKFLRSETRRGIMPMCEDEEITVFENSVQEVTVLWIPMTGHEKLSNLNRVFIEKIREKNNQT